MVINVALMTKVGIVYKKNAIIVMLLYSRTYITLSHIYHALGAKAEGFPPL